MKTTRKTESDAAAPDERSNHHHINDHAARIAEAAYFAAERRGFAPGFELEDWLAAEAQIGNTSV